MTTVRAGDGWTYTLTEEDFLWLGRATHAEGGNRAANIWAWLQRLVRFKASSLANLVRGHSQAVSLRWLRTGEFCAPGGQYEGTRYCTEDLLARRDQNIVRPPDEWSADTKQAIALLRKSQLPNPVPRVVDFADRDLADRFVRRNPGALLFGCEGNCYVVDPVSRRWPDNWVTLEAGSSFGRAFFRTTLWASVIGLTGWAAWKYGRR